MSTVKIAAIDLGTVSSRLLCAEMSNGQITASIKRTVITDLGERVDATGVFAPAAIDRVTTVSSRLLCAEMSNGQITASIKRTVITDLGERVDATGVFAPAAIDRVTQACAEFVRKAREFGAQHVCCTLTSAARDVSNGNELLDRLRDLGLVPQVIPAGLFRRSFLARLRLA